jgi:hypothetical protein
MHRFFDVNEVDTLLNIIESPQLIQSAKSVYDLLHSKELTFRALLTRGGRGKVARKALLKSLSGNYLAYSFAVAPLISDMTKINRAIKTIKSRMDEYVRSYNREYTVTAKCNGYHSIVGDLPGFSNNPNLDNSSYWHLRLNDTFVPTRIVGVRGKRNVEYSTDAFKRLDYMIRRFVATGPATLAWELIPFSFVVDWFVNLSGVLDSLDNTLTGGSKRITHTWMSEKYRVLAMAYKHKYNGWASDKDGLPIAHNEFSYYHREPLNPDPSIGGSGRFGKKQATLSVALIHQLVANLKTFKLYGRL